MRFFVFTCLLAVALAKHGIKQRSASEEIVSIYQEKYKQDSNAAIRTNQETPTVSSSEESVEVQTEKDEHIEEENVYLKQLNKIKQIFQKFYIPQYPEVYQQQVVMNPWKHVKTTTYPVPIPETTRIPQEEIFKKIVEMIKFNQLHQFVTPQYVQALQHRVAMTPWHHVTPFHSFPVLTCSRVKGLVCVNLWISTHAELKRQSATLHRAVLVNLWISLHLESKSQPASFCYAAQGDDGIKRPVELLCCCRLT
ncbi:alpha-S2-casein-like A [Lepus europaeus]|uniref:alpha-S2-casein-like A n=1 Tax=Lepus europaeus TaxID=9983 RepID=UPI002B46B1BD|nr:alpha-S2-casein-like A [Lepus europaeus]